MTSPERSEWPPILGQRVIDLETGNVGILTQPIDYLAHPLAKEDPWSCDLKVYVTQNLGSSHQNKLEIRDIWIELRRLAPEPLVQGQFVWWGCPELLFVWNGKCLHDPRVAALQDALHFDSFKEQLPVLELVYPHEDAIGTAIMNLHVSENTCTRWRHRTSTWDKVAKHVPQVCPNRADLSQALYVFLAEATGDVRLGEVKAVLRNVDELQGELRKYRSGEMYCSHAFTARAATKAEVDSYLAATSFCRIGKDVQLHNLVRRPELNGRKGIVKRRDHWRDIPEMPGSIPIVVEVEHSEEGNDVEAFAKTDMLVKFKNLKPPCEESKGQGIQSAREGLPVESLASSGG